jgi:hypothetical protein
LAIFHLTLTLPIDGGKSWWGKALNLGYSNPKKWLQSEEKISVYFEIIW